VRKAGALWTATGPLVPFENRFGPAACQRAPTSLLGRSFLRGAETRGKDAACLCPQAGN
jgi:hypothetical protein